MMTQIGIVVALVVLFTFGWQGLVIFFAVLFFVKLISPNTDIQEEDDSIELPPPANDDKKGGD
jgi:hypothetical protein